MTNYSAARWRTRRPGLIDELALATWIPTSASGLVLWLEADKITGLNDGDNIATWPDVSGSGYNATQANGAIQPNYNTNFVNGLPVATFATGDGMATICNLGNPYTVAVIYRPTAAGLRVAAGSNNWLIGPYSGNHQVYNNNFTNLGAVTLDTWVYITVVGTSGGITARINGGGEQTSANNGTPGNLCFATSGSYGESFVGNVAGMIAYNTNLSSANVLLLEAYIKRKYGL